MGRDANTVVGGTVNDAVGLKVANYTLISVVWNEARCEYIVCPYPIALDSSYCKLPITALHRAQGDVGKLGG